MDEDCPKYVIDIAKTLRKKQTVAEKILWELLRKKKLGGYKFRRQHPIGRYVLDFFCDEEKICIEIDGEIHNLINSKEYDEIRQKELESQGIKVLRFRNEEIFNNIEKVLKEILEKLQSAYK